MPRAATRSFALCGSALLVVWMVISALVTVPATAVISAVVPNEEAQARANTEVRVNATSVPNQFVAVVADDEPDWLARTSEMLEIVLLKLGFQPVILPATSIQMLLTNALTGKAGGQADLVVLDGSYSYAVGLEWFDKAPPIRGPAIANTLAQYLRDNGYAGRIVLTSSYLPDYVGKPGSEFFDLAIKKGGFLDSIELFRQLLLK
jgi:hypothetical protein